MTEELPSSISLVSSSCRDIFDKNTRTSFTNLLHSRISRRYARRDVCVRPYSIGISTFSNEDPQPVKIHLREIVGQISDSVSSTCIGVFHYPSNGVNSGYLHYTFENSVFLPIRPHQAQTFEINITNIDDEPIAITEGGDTIVTLEVTDNNMLSQNSFTVSCSSNQPDVYSSNTLTNFTSPLANGLNLDEDYQVALHSIIYPSKLYEETIAWIRINGIKFSYDLADFENTIDFLQEVRLDVLQTALGSEVLFEMSRIGPMRGKVVLMRDEETIDADLPEFLPVQLSREFGMICGLLNTSFTPQVLRRGQTIIIGENADINHASPNPAAILESNVVKSGMIGNMRGNILQCVPVLTEGKMISHSSMFISPKLFFQPVARRPMESINFRFLNPDGSQRVFKCRGRNKEIIVTLVFRRQSFSYE